MTRKTLFATAALMGLVAMQPAAVLAEAAGAAAEPATVPATSADAAATPAPEALEEVSRAGFEAVQLMGAALRALSDEQRDTADEALARAERLLDGVAEAVPASGAAGDGGPALLPIYSKVDLVTESEPTEAQKGHFAEARAHMKAGDDAAALAALKAGGARFGVTRYLMPVAPTADHVKAARAAIAEDKASDAMSKLVEANRGLKSDYKVVDIPS